MRGGRGDGAFSRRFRWRRRAGWPRSDARAGERPEPDSRTLPTIRIGKHRVTRLVAGSNPVSGDSYLGRHMDRLKRTDGVIVGMYPRFHDEIGANVRYTREFSKGK